MMWSSWLVWILVGGLLLWMFRRGGCCGGHGGHGNHGGPGGPGEKGQDGAGSGSRAGKSCH